MASSGHLAFAGRHSDSGHQGCISPEVL